MSNLEQAYEQFINIYNRCKILNHIEILGSNEEVTASVIVSCVDLFKQEEKQDIRVIFEEYINQLDNLLVQYGVTDYEYSVKYKMFNPLEKPSWQKKLLD